MAQTISAKVRKDGSLSLPKTARDLLGLRQGETVKIAVRKRGLRASDAARNPLLAIIGITAAGVADGAENHDVYLYGKKRS